jgi:hypothetical protein
VTSFSRDWLTFLKVFEKDMPVKYSQTFAAHCMPRMLAACSLMPGVDARITGGGVDTAIFAVDDKNVASISI